MVILLSAGVLPNSFLLFLPVKPGIVSRQCGLSHPLYNKPSPGSKCELNGSHQEQEQLSSSCRYMYQEF